MNTLPPTPSSFTRALALATVCGAALALAACRDRQEKTVETNTPVPTASPANPTATQAWGQGRTYAFDRREDFSRELKARQAQLEANLSELRADYSEAQASASRRAAMEELRRAEVDFKEKLAAVGTATSDTWDSTRDGVVAAWDDLQAAYAKARAD